MFEKLSNVKIEGGYYGSGADLELFKDKRPLSIIYGLNGSGKTTIAKAIRQMVGKESDEEGASYYVDTHIEDFEWKKDSVFVFDDEFVRENVKMKGKGLETIIMLGEQVDLDKQISHKRDEKRSLEEKKNKLVSEQALYEDEKDPHSPKYFDIKIRAELRKEKGWADVDKDVKGNTIKSRVTDDLITKFQIMEEPQETEAALRDQFDKDWKLYKQANNAQTIEWKAETLILPDNLEGVRALLEKRIEKPHLSDREQKLLSFLQEHPNHYDLEKSQRMSEEKWEFCPLCMREINDKVYDYINGVLSRIMNRESEIYTKALDEYIVIFDNVEVSLSALPEKLFEEEKKKVEHAIRQLNQFVDEVKLILLKRKRDVYGIMKNVFAESGMNKYIARVADVKDAISALETSVNTFNQAVNDRNKLAKRLLDLNFKLARKQISSILSDYKKANRRYQNCLKEISDLNNEIAQVDSDIEELLVCMRRTDIALDYINNELKYVFYSDKKMRLEAGDGCYRIKINENNVSPKKISVGETNVIALCYFFARLFSNKKEDIAYKDEMLLVIDDPVSSFDQGSRLGIMSLLRYQFYNIRKGCDNSRILVLTHDLRTAFDLVKIRSELNNHDKYKKFLVLENKEIRERKVLSEYKVLLDSVYAYAKDSSATQEECIEISIGNVMRRLLEAFASFCYNMSFEQMLCREDVLQIIPNEKRKYYGNFMYRLALHGESHMEERVYSLNVMTPYFTHKEKVQTARSLLLLLLYINKEHLSCYFSERQGEHEDKMAVIQSWTREEADWIK